MGKLGTVFCRIPKAGLIVTVSMLVSVGRAEKSICFVEAGGD